MLTALARTGADYVHEQQLPVGAGVEGITYTALRRAALAARLPQDREHVTTFLKHHMQAFNVSVCQPPPALRRPDLRLTVDTGEDLEHMRALFARRRSDLPTLRQIIRAAGAGPLSEVA